MSICAQVVGKQRLRRCCCLRAQAASKSISNWGNVFVSQSVRQGRWRGTLKSQHLGLQHSRQNLLPEGQSRPLDIPPADLQLQAPSRQKQLLLHKLWGGSLFLPQSGASAAHTGHWTRKRCLEASSEAMGMHYRERHVRRGIKKKNIWAMLSCLYPSLKQFVSTSAGPGCSFQPLTPRTLGTWTPRAHTFPQGPFWTPIWELLV